MASWDTPHIDCYWGDKFPSALNQDPYDPTNTYTDNKTSSKTDRHQTYPVNTNVYII